jgi:hypothetical protein
MNKKPAHLSGTAGQIVNRDIGDTEEMLYTGKAVYTIGDYVKQVQEQEASKKKLTFEEWWARQLPRYGDRPFEYMVDAAEAGWKAAQENK